MHDCVVPLFALGLGWAYGHSSKGDELISPTGVRTRAQSGWGLPQPKDRLVLLFLASMALRGKRVEFHTSAIPRRFGLSWRRKDVIKRLHRVLTCRIELPAHGEWRPMKIVEWYDPNPITGNVTVVFEDGFLLAADDGVPYSLDVLRRTAAKIAVAELYLKLLCTLSRGVYRASWAPYDELRAAKSASKRRQQLDERIRILRAAWPENPFRVMEGCRLTCSKRDFEHWRFGRDPDEHENAMRAEIEGRSHEEFAVYLETLPPWRRDELRAFYMHDWMFPRVRDDVAAFMGSPPTEGMLETVQVALDSSVPLVSPIVERASNDSHTLEVHEISGIQHEPQRQEVTSCADDKVRSPFEGHLKTETNDLRWKPRATMVKWVRKLKFDSLVTPTASRILRRDYEQQPSKFKQTVHRLWQRWKPKKQAQSQHHESRN